MQGKISRSPLRTHSMDTVDLKKRCRNLSTAALTPLSCCPLECPDPKCRKGHLKPYTARGNHAWWNIDTTMKYVILLQKPVTRTERN